MPVVALVLMNDKALSGQPEADEKRQALETSQGNVVHVLYRGQLIALSR
jgi:hypothetical protein